MAIIIKATEASNLGGRVIYLYADRKSEVPETTAETVTRITNDRIKALTPGDFIYTGDGSVATASSEGTWSWWGE